MVVVPEIRLASLPEASAIAEMSRDCIEHGLKWSWTYPRVVKAIRSTSSNVVVAHDAAKLLGFGIMSYADEKAHLQLLCVHGLHRRQGIGSRIVTWLEKCAETCGIRWIQVEARADNPIALSLYEKLGYDPMDRVCRYYSGKVDAIRFIKDLWSHSSAQNCG
jgi:ribosomal protein S18 acetylase RimI-like enzyme